MARVANKICTLFVRLRSVRLYDDNERNRYLQTVLDDEVEKCRVGPEDKAVDCLVYREGGLRGIEFTSYVEKADLQRMLSELSQKRVPGGVCTLKNCALVVAIPKDAYPYVLERARALPQQLRICSASSPTELVKKACEHEVILLKIKPSNCYQ